MKETADQPKTLVSRSPYPTGSDTVHMEIVQFIKPNNQALFGCRVWNDTRSVTTDLYTFLDESLAAAGKIDLDRYFEVSE